MCDARQPEVDMLHSWAVILDKFFLQIVSIRAKKLSNTNLVASRYFKREKSSRPVDVRRSKTSLLKLPSNIKGFSRRGNRAWVPTWGTPMTRARAFTSPQCGRGLSPGIDAICGLSVLTVLSLPPRGFSAGTLVFPSPQKPDFPNWKVSLARFSNNNVLRQLPWAVFYSTDASEAEQVPETNNSNETQQG